MSLGQNTLIGCSLNIKQCRQFRFPKIKNLVKVDGMLLKVLIVGTNATSLVVNVMLVLWIVQVHIAVIIIFRRIE